MMKGYLHLHDHVQSLRLVMFYLYAIHCSAEIVWCEVFICLTYMYPAKLSVLSESGTRNIVT